MTETKKGDREYVFELESDLEHYEAEAFVVRCLDARFWKVAKDFIASLDMKDIDPAFPAGGAKVFSSPFEDFETAHYLGQIEKSIRLHKTKKVILFSHHDCGAYGGFDRFDRDPSKELEFHRREHIKAVQVIQERFPNLEIETYFLDERGVIKTF